MQYTKINDVYIKSKIHIRRNMRNAIKWKDLSEVPLTAIYYQRQLSVILFAKFTTFWGIDMTSRCSGALFSALFVEMPTSTSANRLLNCLIQKGY